MAAVRDTRPSDWFIAGMFVTLGVVAASVIVGALAFGIVGLVIALLIHK